MPPPLLKSQNGLPNAYSLWLTVSGWLNITAPLPNTFLSADALYSNSCCISIFEIAIVRIEPSVFNRTTSFAREKPVRYHKIALPVYRVPLTTVSGQPTRSTACLAKRTVINVRSKIKTHWNHFKRDKTNWPENCYIQVVHNSTDTFRRNNTIKIRRRLAYPQTNQLLRRIRPHHK